DQNFVRRDFLKGAVLGGAAAATTTVAVTPPQEAQAQQPPTAAPQAAAPASPGYAFLNLEEAAFVETLVDHVVPADDLTPKTPARSSGGPTSPRSPRALGCAAPPSPTSVS